MSKNPGGYLNTHEPKESMRRVRRNSELENSGAFVRSPDTMIRRVKSSSNAALSSFTASQFALAVVTLLLSAFDSADAHAQSGDPLQTSSPTSMLARDRTIEIVHVGNTGSLKSFSATSSLYGLLANYFFDRPETLTIQHSGMNVLFRPERIFFDATAVRLRPIVEKAQKHAFDTMPFEEVAITLIESDESFVYQYPADPNFDVTKLYDEIATKQGLGASLKRVPAILRIYREGDDVFHEVIAGAEKSATRTKVLYHYEHLDQWEFSFGGIAKIVSGDVSAQFYFVGKPMRYGPRLIKYVRDTLVAKYATRPLLVSPGKLVGTLDSATGEPEPFREEAFKHVGALNYDAIAPGNNELFFGVEPLKGAAARYRINLVASNLFDTRSKDAIFPRYLIKNINGIRVGFIGFVSSSLASQVESPDVVSDVEVRDPAVAAKLVLRDLDKLPHGRPDLIVALSNLQNKDLYQLWSDVEGIDVIITTGWSWQMQNPRQHIDAQTRKLEAYFGRVPLLLTQSSFQRVGKISVDFARDVPRTSIISINTDDQTITPDLPNDADLHHTIFYANLREQLRLDRVIIPSLERIVGKDQALWHDIIKYDELSWLDPNPQMKTQLQFTADLWSVITANLMMNATRSDAAFVEKRDSLGVNIPGDASEAYVYNWLLWGRFVERYPLSGQQLAKLVRELDGKSTWTGIDDQGAKVSGRVINPDETYHVALESKLTADPKIKALLGDNTKETRFRESADKFIADDEQGKPLAIRTLVMARLTDLRAKHPQFDAAYCAAFRPLLRIHGDRVRPRWFIEAKDLTVSFSNYSNFPRRSWLRNPGVRETRTVTPANYTLGIGGTLRAGYDHPAFEWSNAGTFKFSRTVIDLVDVSGHNTTQESLDDVLLSSELKLNFLQLSRGEKQLVRLVPFVNVTYDTEFTPTVNSLTNQPFPHQKDLLSSVGSIFFPGRIIDEIRTSFLIKTDFAATQGIVEPGVALGVATDAKFWAATLKLGSELQYYFSMHNDTVEDLGVIIKSYAKFLVPFTKDFSLSLFADGYAYRPKIAISQDVITSDAIRRNTALSLILGAGITFNHLWKLYDGE